MWSGTASNEGISLYGALCCVMVYNAPHPQICSRHYSVGADGVIFALPGKDGADYTMRIYNSDGELRAERREGGSGWYVCVCVCFFLFFCFF